MSSRPDQSSFRPESLACVSATPNLLLKSSRDLAWGVLLDHQQGDGRSDIFETHPTGDITLVVAVRGRHQIQVCKQARWHTAMYEVGNAGLTEPYDTTRISWRAVDPSDRFETAHLYLPKAIVNAIAEEYRRVGSRHTDHPLSALVFRDQTIANVMLALVAAMHDAAPRMYADQASRFLAAHLLAGHARWWDVDEDGRSPPQINDRQMERVLEYMSARFGDDLSLSELAAEACISVHHFVRRFRERMGLTPFAYLTTIRIEAARRLLITSDLSVSEIAQQCGYSNAGAFSNAFNRHVGTSPRRFRLDKRR